ncbi:MAG: hypothetical protein QOH46_626, partial [Solirubrobacteraceae bacterium]|nr:hypothetical protein [Solirubrobacteraceae bacterium]
MPTLRSAPTAEGSLRIGGDDVERFAAASGDRNPLHLDAQFARRTAFGEPVVHGALVTLALLGLLPDDALAAARGLRVSFSGPVLRDIDAAAAAGPDERLEGGWWATLSARGKDVTRVRLWSAGGPLEPPAEVDLVEDAPMRDRPAVVVVDALSESR